MVYSHPALVAPEGYTPKGTVSTLPDSDLPCYEVGSGDKAVIVCYDIFGIDAGRNKGICDEVNKTCFFVSQFCPLRESSSRRSFSPKQHWFSSLF